MALANWDKFAKLPGAATSNFEMLCRALVRRHYSQYGDFKALANQPGIEFHLHLKSACDLGEPGRWYGWQCKWYELSSGTAIGTTRRTKIEEAIAKTEAQLPEITDWVLWTRHTLTRSDQTWFYGLKTKFKLALMTSIDVEDMLAGPAAILRETYFGELVLTPQALSELHSESIAPFSTRWTPEVHHTVEAERELLCMLGSPNSWASISRLEASLRTATALVLKDFTRIPATLQPPATALIEHANSLANRLRQVHDALQEGELEKLQALMAVADDQSKSFRFLLHKLRSARSSISLNATNLVADIQAANTSLSSMNVALCERLVAIVAAAGDGKTELAIQLTLPDIIRPAGVFLLGRDLHSGQSLDDMAQRVKIYGEKVSTFDRLVEAVDAAGRRAGRRIPIVIDGLNEAEDPRNWKAALASADILLARNPYVLLVCTLRNQFTAECVPELTTCIELSGFKDDTDTAIKGYFEFYKIDATDADLPIQLLEHPLSLKMYCEVTNPRRDRIVGVEAMPGSLTVLFEKYLDITSTRIAELSPTRGRIFPNEVRDALSIIGGLLWTTNARSIGFDELRQKLGDDRREWQYSLVRSMESEGLLIRTTEEGKRNYGVAMVYDLLAGHLIADYLLEREIVNPIEEWFKQSRNISRLRPDREGTHTLRQDVFCALIGLFTLRFRGKQLWPIFEMPMRSSALLLAASHDASHIDRETVEELSKLMCSSANAAHYMFVRLQITRAAQAHPLDCNFLDTFLRTLRNADRDLLWTEWVRKNESEVLKDVQRLEERWGSGNISEKQDALRAKWVMWTLTSTSRSLRDQSTRALYTYCCTAPQSFFALTLDSLSVSDPYVPERMLAAAYGATLSIWTAPEGAVLRDSLPSFAVKLVDHMFAPEGQSTTWHTLMRESALGLIATALKVTPDCIAADRIDLLKSPFKHLASPFVGHEGLTTEERKQVADSMGMDFRNYTLGHLIPNRANYDFEHTDYKEMLSAILFRMFKLGYSTEKLGNVDRDIGRDSFRNERQTGKTDRYGKKYAWIAYFEMWGWRESQKSLPDWRQGERVPDVDIDPSFPSLPKIWFISVPEIFIAAPTAPEGWIGSGPQPDYSEFLEMSEIDGVPGPWILLDGFIEETSKADDRQVFTFFRGAMVDIGHADILIEAFKATEYPGNTAIPNASERHYTFAGEMPFKIHPSQNLDSGKIAGKDELQNAFSYHDGTNWKPGIQVEIPVQTYAWESHHSSLNLAGGVTLPSSALTELLNMSYRRGEWDMYDSTGKSSLFRKVTTESNRLRGHLTYLRRDLLKNYLQNSGKKLVSFIWGERGFHYRAQLNQQDNLQNIYAAHKHIHKSYHVKEI